MNANKLLSEKIKSRIFVEDTACWTWEGSRLRGGYGAINVGGKTHQVHRVMYEEYIGEIPEGMLVCHR